MFDKHDVSFVSVTQSFNTTTSMGRLTLNVLLSFAQFEREVTGERIRDKIAASKKKGMWMGGVPLGYRVEDRALRIVDDHAAIVRSCFAAILRREAWCASSFRSASAASDRWIWTAARPTNARAILIDAPVTYCKREIIQGRFATVRSYRAPHFPL